MELGDADGHGRYGMLDETSDGLVCHECGRAAPTSACTLGEATACSAAAEFPLRGRTSSSSLLSISGSGHAPARNAREIPHESTICAMSDATHVDDPGSRLAPGRG